LTLTGLKEMSQVCYIPELYGLLPASSALTGSLFYHYKPQLQSLPHTAVRVTKMQLAIKSLLIPLELVVFLHMYAGVAAYNGALPRGYPYSRCGWLAQLTFPPLFLTPCFHTPPSSRHTAAATSRRGCCKFRSYLFPSLNTIRDAHCVLRSPTRSVGIFRSTQECLLLVLVSVVFFTIRGCAK
jgi:hypothetical protein